MPVPSSIKTSLQKIRRQFQGTAVESSKLMQTKYVHLPQKIVTGSDGRNLGFLFLQATLEGNIYNVIHGFFIGCTFKICYKQFSQLYVYAVHVGIQSTSKEPKIIPFAYALLKSKSHLS